MNEEFIWIEKYRPKTIEDIILPQEIKEQFKQYINQNKIPNLLFTSNSPGLGKTSLAKILVKETDADLLFLNGNLDTGIDIMRSRVIDFCSSVSIDGNPKIIILDECESLSVNSINSLKSTIETFTNITFIFTANFIEKIPEALRNRLIHFDFDEIYFHNKKEIMKGLLKRGIEILDKEGIEYNKEDVLEIIKVCYPSSRNVIKNLQVFSIDNKLVLNDKLKEQGNIFNVILDYIKEKDFNNMMNTIQNVVDPGAFYTFMFKNLNMFNDSIKPEIILIIAKYQDMDNRARDKIITLGACCVEIMTKM